MFINSSAKYYQVNKERLQQKLMRDIKIFKKKKKQKWQYCREGHKNLPKDGKQKLVEYRKMSYYNYMKLFSLETFRGFLGLG